MKPTIHYCTTADGVRLAYAVSGDGPVLVKSANWFTHLERDWDGNVWGPTLRELSDHFRLIPDSTPDMVREMNDLARESASADTAARIFRVMQTEIDLMDRLPRVRVPTLVLHCRGDRRVPFEEGQELAARIPNARFVAVESSNHVPLHQDTACRGAFDEIDRFLGATPRREVRLRRKAERVAGDMARTTRAIEASTIYKVLAIVAVLATLASLFL